MSLDPIQKGIETGWQYLDASSLSHDLNLETEVVIVGTGMGGSTAASVLSEAGLRVLLLEAGTLSASRQFDLEERTAYSTLYRQGATMKTTDGAIRIYQGQIVGGSSVIDWGTCYRAPEQTLAYWKSEKSITGLSVDELAPWYDSVEARLSIQPWSVTPNHNNQVLLKGCQRLNWGYQTTRRNVIFCQNLGYCGMGCPLNAKQATPMTSLLVAMSQGALLISSAQATKLVHRNNKVNALEASAVNAQGKWTGTKLIIKAKYFTLAAGAIHTPALLMRSEVPDPYQLIGKRTFLHPSVFSGARFESPINGHSGAPQSVYSDHFLWRNGVTGALGYQLEVPPLHPVYVSHHTLGYGKNHAALMKDFTHLQMTMAKMRDGFHNDSIGGQVHLTETGYRLEYTLSPTFWYAAKHALFSMAELQFAAGAQKVWSMHDDMPVFSSWLQARQAINAMTLAPLTTIVSSTEVMGGCPMGNDETISVVNSYGQHHHLDNAYVMDGSVFPTSLGVGPQLTIGAISARSAAQLLRSIM